MKFQFYLADKAAIIAAESEILAKNRDRALMIAVNATLSIVNSDPDAYKRYGVYWFSVKDILNRNSPKNFGEITDETLVSTYSCATDLQTLIAAQNFMEFYNANFFQGTSTFYVNENGDRYQLVDEDMDMEVS